MNISKNDIIILQEIEKIFVNWWQYKNEKTYKDKQDEAEKIIIEGLKIASNAYPKLKKIAELHGVKQHHPDLEEASGHNALAELEMNYIGEDTEEIEHYRNFLIIELVEQKNWKSIIQYYALARDIHRWIDILKRAETYNTDEKPQVELSSDLLQVRIYDKWYDITEATKDMLNILFEAEGGWVGGKTIGGRPDKLRNKMPEIVANIIETNAREGYRIKPEFFRS